MQTGGGTDRCNGRQSPSVLDVFAVVRGVSSPPRWQGFDALAYLVVSKIGSIRLSSSVSALLSRVPTAW